MLNRNRRVDSELFKKIISEGSSLREGFLSLKYIKTPQELTRVSFSVPKKTEKGAVKRNKIKRIGRDTLRELLPNIINGYAAVIFIHATSDLSDLTEAIKKILHKAGIFE